MRLAAFLVEHRLAIIERCQAKVSGRLAPRANPRELERGIPMLLDQLIETLRLQLVSNPDVAGAATRHGGELLKEGFTVAQVVHDYGDVCQSVTELAIELDAPLTNEDFRILNRCLDDAIAAAVTEFTRLRDLSVASDNNERLGIFAHELRNLLGAATLAFDALKDGSVGIRGPTGAVLERSLSRLNALITRSLTEVRLDVGLVQHERLDVGRLLEEIEISATSAAKARGVSISIVPPGDPDVSVHGDPQILSSVLVNLVQNAIKFTSPMGHVTLTGRADASRVAIDIADQCGGLPPGLAETMFAPFHQHGGDRTGLGLGLVIALRAVEAQNGKLLVRDVPGIGCVFTVELPRA